MNKIVSSIILVVVILGLGLLFFSKKDPTPLDTIPEPEIVIEKQPETEKPVVQPKKSALRTFNINNMKIAIQKEGEGEAIVNGNTAVVHYTGKLTDGTVFDSSVTRGTPFEFPLGAGMVIEGWEKGVLGMKVGEVRTLTIPPEMGYGARGAGALIPPNATLVFEVELLGIK